MNAGRHWTILFNPTAGTFRAAALEQTQRALRDAGVRSDFLATSHAGHATELCRSLTGTDCVACYSGDGTLNEAAVGLLGRDLPLAFLPGGTANVMAHEMGLPRDPVQAARMLAGGKPVSVRPGLVGNWPFLLMAGIGFDAEAVRRVSPRVKARIGKAAYVLAGLGALVAPPVSLRMTGGDGTRLDAVWIVAARARKYGGPFVVHPQAGLECEQLGVAAIGRGRVLPFLIGNLGLGASHSRPGRWLLQQRSLVVEAEAPVPLQVDGDFRGYATRFEIGLCTQTVRLVLPGR
jgi:diacylglycerol kinase (ATP)